MIKTIRHKFSQFYHFLIFPFFFFYAHLSATYPTEDSPTGSFGVYEENHHLEVKILWNENIPMHACITIRFPSEFVFLLFRGFFIH